MKIALGDFTGKLNRKCVFNPTVGNDALYRNSNENGDETVKVATFKKLFVRRATVPHRNICKCCWISRDTRPH